MIKNPNINVLMKKHIEIMLNKFDYSVQRKFYDCFERPEDTIKLNSFFLELLAGTFLRLSNLELEYEYHFKVQKPLVPDWVIMLENQPAAVVEVKTIFTNAVYRNYNRLYKKVSNEIKNLHVGVSLTFDFMTDIYNYNNNDLPDLIGLTKSLNTWLSNPDLRKNSVFNFNGLKFKFNNFSNELTNPELIVSPNISIGTNAVNIKDYIFEKVIKYKPILQKFKLPYILIIIKTSKLTNFKFSDVEDLFLSDNYNEDENNSISLSIDEKNQMKYYNIFKKFINYIIWLEESTSFNWNTKLIDLESQALFKLDYQIIEAFDKLENISISLNE